MTRHADSEHGNVIRLRRSPFERSVEPYLDGLRRLALRLCGNRDDAEDLIQDLFAQLYSRIDEIDRLDDPAPWLRRVLYRRFVDGWRRRRADPVDHGSEAVEAAAPVSDCPDEVFERALDRERLQQALDALSLDHRTVLLLHDVEEYTLPEVADMLGIAEGTLKSRLHRARNRLREILVGRNGTKRVRDS